MKSVSYMIFRKWITWLVSIFIAAIVIFGYLYHIRQKEIEREERYMELRAVSVLKVGQLTQWYRERTSEARFFTTSIPYSQYAQQILDGEADAGEKYRNSLLLIMTDGRYENIFMIDNGGELLFSVMPGFNFNESETKNVALQVFQNGNIMFTDFYYCAPHNRIHFDIVAPLFQSSGEIFAVLVFRTDPSEYLYPLIREWPTPRESAETYIVRRDKDSITYLSDLKFHPNSSLNLRVPLTGTDISIIKALSDSTFTDTKQNITEGKDYRGKRVISDVRWVPGTNWNIVSEIDTDEVFKEVNRRSLMLAIIILLLMLSSGFSIAWLYQFRQRNIYRELLNRSGELHESQEEFEAILYSIGDGVITTDSYGKIKEMNPVAERVTGWSEEESRGRALQEVFNITDNYASTESGNMANRLISQSIASTEITGSVLISKNGAEIPVSESRAPIKDQRGEITGEVILFRDRTEERLREDMIIMRLELLEFAADNSLDDIIIKALDIIGYFTRAPLIFYQPIKPDSYIESVTYFSSGDMILKRLNRPSFSGSALMNSEVVSAKLSDKRAFIDNVVSPISEFYLSAQDFEISRLMIVPVNNNNEITAYVCAINKSADFTERDVEIVYYFDEILKDIYTKKSAQIELINLKNELEIKVIEKTSDLLLKIGELESFSYSVSHDLRAPLRAIDGFTRILMEDHSKNLSEDGQRIGRIIIENTQKMGQLIDDLLAFSRLSRAELKASYIETERMVNSIIREQTNDEIRERVIFNIKPLCNCWGDQSMIRQVWVNLISNAIKFSSTIDRAIIDIWCRKNGEMIEFFVRDNGVGFDMNYKDKLFGVFQRLHSAKDFEGTGVGLAIVERVVHRHGGEVSATGEVAVGAQFSFSLPSVKRDFNKMES